jgi:hypothetical protein
MATIYDGVPVFAPVAGNTALAADQVTFQAKMILGMETRTITAPIQGGQPESPWVYVDINTSNPPYWSEPAAPPVNSEMIVPLPYTPTLTRIISIGVVVDGNVQAGDLTQGSIALWERPHDNTPTAWGVPAAGAVDIGGAAPWQLAGVVTEHTVAGLTFDTVAKSEYAVMFQSGSTVGPARNHYIYSVWYTAQFHRGT